MINTSKMKVKNHLEKELPVNILNIFTSIEFDRVVFSVRYDHSLAKTFSFLLFFTIFSVIIA